VDCGIGWPTLPNENAHARLMRSAFDRAWAYQRLAAVELALTAFWQERQRMPERLDELVPGYLHALPLDPFCGRPFVYRDSADGYVLYSRGEDRGDDGGQAPAGY
jgi:hypothetical protein